MIKRLLELLAILAMAVSLVAFSIAVTGCQSTGSTQTQPVTQGSAARAALDVAVTSVDSAMKSYYAWAVQKERKNAALPPLDRGPAQDALLSQEGKVNTMFSSYKNAMNIAMESAKSSLANNQTPEIATALAAAASLIAQLSASQN